MRLPKLAMTVASIVCRRSKNVNVVCSAAKVGVHKATSDSQMDMRTLKTDHEFYLDVIETILGLGCDTGPCHVVSLPIDPLRRSSQLAC